MSDVRIPVRYYKDYEGGYEHGFEDLVLSLDSCAFLLVDVDGGYSFVPNAWIWSTTLRPSLRRRRTGVAQCVLSEPPRPRLDGVDDVVRDV